ncbi:MULTISPECIES: hypothetical protein [Sutcliffiella]|uniref:Abortive phage infection protein n=1 Tax=Sutcliffiella cohnii TaxID=33932 RepID=A0A223KPL1_9BACI|nr:MULTISPECIES: hypothetical protein [Sutcliffiella]AST91455.1 hypothetical protein BC6307_09265 [Sutcliffiella cohnii]WBL17283.1 hypothetical protein O1A01_11895 [Sutcliffiella sp. NC1]
MNEQFVTEILDKLRSRELHEYMITKENFMDFRRVLVAQEDFKQFRGIAKHNGEILYKYEDEPRS